MSALRFRHRTTAPAPSTFAWTVAHASDEDRALGLELELIELVQQRRSVRLTAIEAETLDREIARVSDELVAIADHVQAA